MSTFICLLFSVLYCGAKTAASSIWDLKALQDLDKKTIIERLRACCDQGLDACQYRQYPNLKTLVSLLLMQACSSSEGSAQDRAFVCLVLHAAQSLGLHQEKTYLDLDVIEAEMHRRTWWHIIWLDVQTSLMTSLPLCSGTTRVQELEIDTDKREDSTKVATEHSTASDSVPKKDSIAILLAVGHCLSAKFRHSLISTLESTGTLIQCDIENISKSMKYLHDKLDKLIGRIHVEGLPERGLIPSDIANASPITHQELYRAEVDQPTVPALVGRMVLTMLKMETTILWEKLLLRGLDPSHSDRSTWERYVVCCIEGLGQISY